MLKTIVGIVVCIIFFPVVLLSFLMFYLPEWLFTDKTFREIHKDIWR